MTKLRGKFIVLEGGEGSGKSTQAHILADKLISKGITVVETREPGGTPGAEEIRKLLVEGAGDRWGPAAELGMFMAARADHVEKKIEPALARGDWVVCDRFLASTLAYQGEAGGLETSRIMQAHMCIVGMVYPDLTIILDVPPEVGLRRKHDPKQSPSRFEARSIEFHRRVREAYGRMAYMNGHVLIDGHRSVELVQYNVWRLVVSLDGKIS